jgi:hypothetical protein
MLNLSKSISVFDPETVAQYSILVIGVGATGSLIALNLAKMGISSNITFFDHDVVEDKNVNNQLYFNSHVGKPKVHALYEILHNINPDFIAEQFRYERFEIQTHKKWLSQKTIIYLCVDQGRQNLLSMFLPNTNVQYIIETRIGVDACDVYKITRNPKLRELYLPGVPTPERENNPQERSPCGEVMSIIPAINICAAIASQHIRLLDSPTWRTYVETMPSLGVINEDF